MLLASEIERKLRNDYWIKKLNEISLGRCNSRIVFREHQITIPTEDLSAFKKITVDKALAEFTSLLALFQLALFRFFPGAPVVIATLPFHQSSENENLLFLKSLVSGDQTLRQILESARDELRDSLLNGDYSMEDVAAELPEGYSAFITFSKFSMIYDQLHQAGAPSIDSDLSLQISRSDTGSLKITARYNEALMDDFLVVDMLSYLRQSLKNLETDLRRQISEVEIVSPSQRKLLLDNFRGEHRKYPVDECISSLFEQRVSQVPDAIALVFEQNHYTYRSLNETANKLAWFLRSEMKVQRGDIIGVSLPKSDRVVIILLAILKAGGTYLPIDVSAPEGRKHHIVSQAGMRCVFSASTEGFAGVERIDFDALSLAEFPCDNLPRIHTCTDVAYIIFTSGSTGVPKGVMVEHRSNINMSFDQIRIFGISSQDAVLFFASLSFDASISEVFMALYAGAKLVVISDEKAKNVNHVLAYMMEHQVSVVTFTPSFLALVPDDSLHFLRCLIVAGEAIQSKKMKRLPGGIDCFNAYGPTECAVCVTTYKITREEVTPTIPIGRPIANLSVYILNEHLQLVPVGVKGTLYVAGIGVSRGYLNQTDLTNSRFIPDPFAGSGVMYCTGDVGRWLPNGNIEFFGRQDDQVKLNGYRIELTEIKYQIERCEGVESAFVSVRQDGDDQYLLAYYTPASVPVETITGHLQRHLPYYMIPRHILGVDRFDLTLNGKMDSSGLPVPEQDKFIFPRNKVEECIAAIWSKALTIDRIGMRDNFFQIGGNSLSAFAVINEVNKTFHTQLPINQLFVSPSIEQLATQVDRNNHGAAGFVLPDVEALFVGSTRQIVSIRTMEKARNFHMLNIPLCFRWNKLDLQRFREALDAVVKKHDALRTYFINGNENVYASIEPSLSPPILKTACEAGKLEATLRQLRDEDFEVYDDPLIKVHLIEVANEATYTLILLSHLVVDGTSCQIIVRDLLNAYRGISDHEKTISFSQYISWLNQSDAPIFHKQLEYWKQKLQRDFPRITLPATRVRDPHNLYCHVNRLVFNTDQYAKVQTLCRRLKVTENILITGLIVRALKSWSGAEQFFVAVQTDGRTQPPFKNLVGYLINFFLLQIDLRKNETDHAFFEMLLRDMAEGYANQDYPAFEVIEKLNLSKGNNPSSFNDVMISYNYSLLSAQEHDYLRQDLEVVEIGTREIKPDVAFIVYSNEAQKELAMEICLKQSLFDEIACKTVGELIALQLETFI